MADAINADRSFTFTIPGALPGMNEFIGAMNSNRFAGAHLKKKFTRLVAEYVIANRVPKYDCPVGISIDWYEKNLRRDPDNIAGGGTKIILDALSGRSDLGTGTIPDDGRKWVKAISHNFMDPDKTNPRIEITIVPMPSN
jgi:hypothetical protein